MKKIAPSFCISLLSTLSFTSATAQRSIDKAEPPDYKNDIAYFNADKAIREKNDDHKNLYKINFKAVRDFMTTYPEISNEKWEILNDGYIAAFVLNSVSKKNYYDKKGNWLCSMDQYDETKLPKEVRAFVKSVYYDYAITVVKEVNAKKYDGEPIYLVHIKFNDTFKIIKVRNFEMEEFHFKEKY